jgi:hypothetical protein
MLPRRVVAPDLDSETAEKMHATEKITYRNIEYTPGITLEDKEEIMDYIFNLFNVP